MSRTEIKQKSGQSINGYRILEMLSEGESGAFLRAQDTRLGRGVALVVLKDKPSTQSQSRDQFLQESDAASLSWHPGVARVFEVGRTGKLLYAAMEHIPGPSLHELLYDLRGAQVQLALEEALPIVWQLALALDHVYQQGVAFYGFSSEVVKLRLRPGETLGYRPVLQDPGLSILCDAGLPRNELAYVSPERGRSAKADVRSDIFSLGVLLHELLTGQPPYPIESGDDFVRFYGPEYHPSPRAFRPDLPGEVEDVLLKALEKQPGDRYANAGEFAIALEALVKGRSGQTGAASSLPEKSLLLAALRKSSGQAPAALGSPAPGLSSQPLPAPVGDVIQITGVDGKIRKYPIRRGGLTIGCGEDNDIVIADPKVSGYHAHIDYDGARYRIRDLNSKNGTFLDNQHLEPDHSVIWHPEFILRIGGAWLRLHIAGKPSRRSPKPAEPVRTQEVTRTMPFVPPTVLKGSIGLSIDEAQLSATPGTAATTVLTLYNNGSEDDIYQISVSGKPEEWVVDLSEAVPVSPLSQRAIPLSIQPPRLPESKAGNYPLRLRVASQRDPRAWAEADLVLVVMPYSDVKSEIVESQLQPGEMLQVKVTNQGNAEDAVFLRWEGEGIRFHPMQLRLDVPHQASVTARSRLELVQRRLIGGEQLLPFTTSVQSSGGQEQTHTGNLVSSGLAPLWLPPVAVIAMLILFVGFSLSAVTLAQFTKMGHATETASIQTATGEAIAFATRQAVTSTAIWYLADPDGDGLSNEKELLAGTLPDKADSDNDGLNDGNELAIGTLPRDSDTDKDGWLDGYEVSRRTSPLKPDTDGDGILDPQDPNPLVAPTATVTPTLQGTAGAPNNPPVNSFTRSQKLKEDTALIFSDGNGNQVSVSDSDAGNNQLKVTLTATNGILTLNGTSSLAFSSGDGAEDSSMTFTGSIRAINTALNGLKFIPPADFFGTATLQILTEDQGHSGAGGSKSDADTITIDVLPVNDPPSFTPGKDVTVTEDANPVTETGWAKNISPGPSNEAGQNLDFVITTSNNGLFLQRPGIDPSTGSLSFTPLLHASGSAMVTVKLHDDGGVANGGVDTSQTQTFTITSNPAPDAPADLLLSKNSLRENAGSDALVGAFSTSDPDPVDSFTYHLVEGEGGADNGAFTITGNGLRANASFDHEGKSSYSIRVRVINDAGLSLDKSFVIHVTNQNEPPLPADDGASASEGAPTVINVLANDSDPDGDRLSVTKVGVPSTGSAWIFANTIIYTPTVGFSSAVFTYTVSDGSLTASALVTINPIGQAEQVDRYASLIPGVLRRIWCWLVYVPPLDYWRRIFIG